MSERIFVAWDLASRPDTCIEWKIENGKPVILSVGGKPLPSALRKGGEG